MITIDINTKRYGLIRVQYANTIRLFFESICGLENWEELHINLYKEVWEEIKDSPRLKQELRNEKINRLLNEE